MKEIPQEMQPKRKSAIVIEIREFTDLVDSIGLYYLLTTKSENVDSSEAWKVEAGLLETSIVPKEIDGMVKEAFIEKLKKFV